MAAQLIWFLVSQFIVYWVNSASLYSSISPRAPNNTIFAPDSFSCRLQGSPSSRYPISNSFYSEFNVPPLPEKFSSSSTTYYIYFDLWFDPDGQGEYNQFVPQLMLGNCLCKSTNSGNYNPSWCQFSDWHIGSQYFFTTNNHKTAHAATGDLISVKPGDIVYTEFIYDSTQFSWTLNTGIKNTNSISTVVAKQPYMGIIKDTQSWNEKAYQTTYMSTSWELYGLQDQQSYPKYMNFTSTVKSNNGAANYYENWSFYTATACQSPPKHNLNTDTNTGKTQQVDDMDLFYNAKS
eukprot:108148_1